MCLSRRYFLSSFVDCPGWAACRNEFKRPVSPHAGLPRTMSASRASSLRFGPTFPSASKDRRFRHLGTPEGDVNPRAVGGRFGYWSAQRTALLPEPRRRRRNRHCPREQGRNLDSNDNVVTPGGPRPKSDAHLVRPGQAVMQTQSGSLVITERAADVEEGIGRMQDDMVVTPGGIRARSAWRVPRE